MNRGSTTMSSSGLPLSCLSMPRKGTGLLNQALQLLLVSLLFNATAWAAPDDIPVPDWLSPATVGEKMVINGLPSTVYRFETHETVDALLDFYRDTWRDEGKNSYREAHVAPWYVISRLVRNYLYTVQVKEEGSFTISGYLAVGDLAAMEKSRKHDKPVPLMDGSTVLNDVTSFDPGQKGRTVMLANKYSASGNSQFYRNYFRDRGWATVMDSSSDESFILAFKKRNLETHLVISTVQGVTHVVMNMVEEI